MLYTFVAEIRYRGLRAQRHKGIKYDGYTAQIPSLEGIGVG
jgi:hypothetical protein